MAGRSWKQIADRLFPGGHQIEVSGAVLSGTATLDGLPVGILGTLDQAVIDVETAFKMADAILEIIRTAPGRPILILVDTRGQSVRYRDELLGIGSYMAHLAKCLEMARRRGHRIVSLTYDRAVSGGFIVCGMMADLRFALPHADIQVMDREAMAQVTKLGRERLDALSRVSPVLASGAESLLELGALDGIWSEATGAELKDALHWNFPSDGRTSRGRERGGRRLASLVAGRVRCYGRDCGTPPACDCQARPEDVASRHDVLPR